MKTLTGHESYLPDMKKKKMLTLCGTNKHDEDVRFFLSEYVNGEKKVYICSLKEGAKGKTRQKNKAHQFRFPIRE